MGLEPVGLGGWPIAEGQRGRLAGTPATAWPRRTCLHYNRHTHPTNSPSTHRLDNRAQESRRGLPRLLDSALETMGEELGAG